MPKQMVIEPVPIIEELKALAFNIPHETIAVQLFDGSGPKEICKRECRRCELEYIIAKHEDAPTPVMDAGANDLLESINKLALDVNAFSAANIIYKVRGISEIITAWLIPHDAALTAKSAAIVQELRYAQKSEHIRHCVTACDKQTHSKICDRYRAALKPYED